MTVKNHELVGFVPSFDVIAWNSRCVSQFSPTDYHVVNDAKEFAAVAHLGFVKPDSVHSQIEQGISWAVSHFKNGKVNEFNGGWFPLLSRSMLLCLLARRNSDLRSICDWATPKVKPEYRGSLPDEIQQIYLVLSSLFQDESARGYDKLLDKLQKSRKREVKLLISSLTSIVEGDSSKFASSIQKCVEFHRKKPKPEADAYFMEDWLPIHANTIYLCGLALGIEAPAFPRDIMAYLMTPDSVGF